MGSKLILEVELEQNATQQLALLSNGSTAPSEAMQAMIVLLTALMSGAQTGVVNQKLGAVQASLVGTFTGVATANDTITLNGVVFTAIANNGTISGDQFKIGTTAATAAANLAAAINASASVGIVDVIRATVLSGAVTVWSTQAGKVGNSIPVSETLHNFTFAGAATALAGGTEQTNVTYPFGMVASVSY